MIPPFVFPIQESVTLTKLSPQSIAKVCELLAKEWQAFTALQQHVRALHDAVDKLAQFAKLAVPTRTKTGQTSTKSAEASEPPDPQRAKRHANATTTSSRSSSSSSGSDDVTKSLGSCHARTANAKGRSTASGNAPTEKESVAACAQCILDEYCGFCLDFGASGVGNEVGFRAEDALGWPVSESDTARRRASKYFFHCWEGSTSQTLPTLPNGSSITASEAGLYHVHNDKPKEDHQQPPNANANANAIGDEVVNFCGRPGDTWVHLDQGFADFLSHRDEIAGREQQVAEFLCKTRLAPVFASGGADTDTAVNVDVPHYIAPTDLQLEASDTANPDSVVHPAWSQGILGEECDREVRHNSLLCEVFDLILCSLAYAQLQK